MLIIISPLHHPISRLRLFDYKNRCCVIHAINDRLVGALCAVDKHNIVACYIYIKRAHTIFAGGQSTSTSPFLNRSRKQRWTSPAQRRRRSLFWICTSGKRRRARSVSCASLYTRFADTFFVLNRNCSGDVHEPFIYWNLHAILYTYTHSLFSMNHPFCTTHIQSS